jgi:hypothetical protein
MASPRPWPFDDDDDRPSGSVQPLSQADLQAILAHLKQRPRPAAGRHRRRPAGGGGAGAGHGRPPGRLGPGAVATAAVGRMGGLDPDSALAGRRHPRRRHRRWRAWPSAGAPAEPGRRRVGRRGGRLGRRFRPSPDASAWQRGADGERRTARLLAPLARHGWVVLHDLAIPGSPANLVIGPGGMFVIDSKQYRGRLQLDGSGRRWQGRYPLAHPAGGGLRSRPGARVLPDPGVAVVPIVAVHGARVPWGKVVTGGVPVVAARRLPSMLGALPLVLGPERVAGLANQARIRFHPAA